MYMYVRCCSARWVKGTPTLHAAGFAMHKTVRETLIKFGIYMHYVNIQSSMQRGSTVVWLKCLQYNTALHYRHMHADRYTWPMYCITIGIIIGITIGITSCRHFMVAAAPMNGLYVRSYRHFTQHSLWKENFVICLNTQRDMHVTLC